MGDRVTALGLSRVDKEPVQFGVQKQRRFIKKTGKLRAVQLLIGHSKTDSSMHKLGLQLEDVLSIAERINVYSNLVSGPAVRHLKAGVCPLCSTEPKSADNKLRRLAEVASETGH